MPKFTADRQDYSREVQFGAESIFYIVSIAPPNPEHTIREKDWTDRLPPPPVKDMTLPFGASRDAALHPDYNLTVISDFMAQWFDAEEGDWILITLRDEVSDQEHGFYTRVHEIVEPDDPRHAKLLLRVSAEDLMQEFDILDKVYRNAPGFIRLRAKGVRSRCYHSLTKVDVP